MKQNVRAGLIGVTGYTGMELARLLAGHPRMKLAFAASRSEAGTRLGTLYPFMERLPGAHLRISAPDAALAAKECDVVFLAVPHGAAMETAADLLARGARVVDLSADFRIRDAQTYESWYATSHTRKELLPKAVYGLPELYAAEIAKASLVANPGCYPSAAVLGLYAALRHSLVHTDDIVIDAKSGASGAGRKAVTGSLFCEISDTFKAYGLGKHRHTPEIEQEISLLTGQRVVLSFNTHLLPINRGILATIYTRLRKPASLAEVHKIFTHVWEGSPWIRVLPEGMLPETRNVRGTMFCDIGLATDKRTNRLIIVTAIDNLCRGASGQAVANANIMHGLPAAEGLTAAPLML